jgi:hypothetical protein
MHIVIGKEHASKLAERYTVLPLEEFVRDGVYIEAYCVVPAEKINLGSMINLTETVRVHHEFVDAYKNGNWHRVTECYEHLRGEFGGELDTFYEEILTRQPVEAEKIKGNI